MRKRLALTATLRSASVATAPSRVRGAMLVYDVSLAWTGLLLLALGLVMVYSASIATAEANAHTGFRATYFLLRHTLFVAVGLAAAAVAFQIPMKLWQRLAARRQPRMAAR